VPTAAEPITLTLWLPTEFSAEPARQILAQQLAAFAASDDGAPTQVLIKTDHGPGGLFDLLKSASPVAPRILPDLIALDAAELEPAARAGLLQPIGPLLPADLVADLFPFARELGTVNQALYGVVYRADLEHLAFDSKQINPAPLRWSEIVSATRVYVFTLRDADWLISDTVLAHYLALGGRLIDAEGQPQIDQAALTKLLAQYRQAQSAAVLPLNLLDIDDEAEAWQTFQSTGAALVNVRATRYLSEELRLPAVQFAPLPAFDSPTRPIARGWVLALVAREPRRQAATVRLLQWLLAPDRNGAFTQASRALPGRRAALSIWDQADPYIGFILDQLIMARAAPPASILAVVGPPLSKAIEDVLTGRATPDEAAQTAVNSLNRTGP
jgi:ABC-type glycerol-3-phosphate transport system substrate-binding protein